MMGNSRAISPNCLLIPSHAMPAASDCLLSFLPLSPYISSSSGGLLRRGRWVVSCYRRLSHPPDPEAATVIFNRESTRLNDSHDPAKPAPLISYLATPSLSPRVDLPSSFLRLVIISHSALLRPQSRENERRIIEVGSSLLPPSLPPPSPREKDTLTNGSLILLHLHFGRTSDGRLGNQTQGELCSERMRQR